MILSTRLCLLLLKTFNVDRDDPLPHLAALIAVSAFDVGKRMMRTACPARVWTCTRPTTQQYMSHDLSHYSGVLTTKAIDFAGKYPQDFLVKVAPDHLPVWHLGRWIGSVGNIRLQR